MVDSNFDIGLIGEYGFSDLQVLLNDNPVDYIMGKDFLSFTIPHELRVPNTQVEVSLYSEIAGGESNVVIINLID